MRKRVVLFLVLIASAAWAGDVLIPPQSLWCQILGIRCAARRVVRPESMFLPRGVGVIAHSYDMAIAPQLWWGALNVMPNHAMLDDIAQHDIRIANIWIRVDPFDGTARWCNEQWYPYTGYTGIEMCRGNGNIVDEDMDLFWTHPDFDVLIIRFETWANVEEGCDGAKGLVFEREPTKGIVDTLYERYSEQNKIIIFQNWEADWQLNGVRCRERDQCSSDGWTFDSCIDSGDIENCCDDLKRGRGEYLLRILEQRQAVISDARERNQFANLKVYHAVSINFFEDEWYTVAKDIIPRMTEPPDLVGVSFWKKPPIHVTDALEYVQEHTGLPRHRIYVSELGKAERVDAPAYDRIMNESTLAFEWGCPMVLVWHWKYWGDDPVQQRLSLFELDNETPKSGYWAVRELNDEWR